MSISMLCGLNKKAAVKFTFLMGIPAAAGALILELGQVGRLSLSGRQMAYYMAGAVAAGVTAFFLIKYMVKYLQRAKFRGFACYSFLLGIAAIVCNFLR